MVVLKIEVRFSSKRLAIFRMGPWMSSIAKIAQIKVVATQ